MRLPNLAGKANCDEVIQDELYLAGVTNLESVTKSDSDVPYKFIGRLTIYPPIVPKEVDFTFKRFWYYYVVNGWVSPDVAFLLQKSKYGKQIRPTGDCSPDDYSKYLEWYDSSYQKINTLEHKIEYEEYKDSEGILGKMAREALSTKEFRAPRSKVGDRQFIRSYHIDSLTGLKCFVDNIRGK